ncbi:hypothetical protein BDR03DRAFT_1019612 [Suillus americanus]|nr:hypothetical protein BDR03DRAFT_1019612 [Suillus americanus]
MLDILHSSLNNTIPLHTCTLACADAVFWGQGRLSKFLPTSQSCFSPKFFPTPSSLCSFSSSGESLMCHLPWTKVAKEKGEDIFLGHQLGASDPIALLLAHFAASPAVLFAPNSSHLFTYNSSDSFLRYWHLLEHIAPLHAELLGPKLSPIFAHVLHNTPQDL